MHGRSTAHEVGRTVNRRHRRAYPPRSVSGPHLWTWLFFGVSVVIMPEYHGYRVDRWRHRPPAISDIVSSIAAATCALAALCYAAARRCRYGSAYTFHAAFGSSGLGDRLESGAGTGEVVHEKRTKTPVVRLSR